MLLCGLQAVVKFRGKTHQLYPKGLSGTASALAGAALCHEAGCFSRTSHAPKLSKLSCLSSSTLLKLSATAHNRFNGVAHRASYVGKVPWYFSLVPQNFLTWFVESVFLWCLMTNGSSWTVICDPLMMTEVPQTRTFPAEFLNLNLGCLPVTGSAFCAYKDILWVILHVDCSIFACV